MKPPSAAAATAQQWRRERGSSAALCSCSPTSRYHYCFGRVPMASVCRRWAAQQLLQERHASKTLLRRQRRGDRELQWPDKTSISTDVQSNRQYEETVQDTVPHQALWLQSRLHQLHWPLRRCSGFQSRAAASAGPPRAGAGVAHSKRELVFSYASACPAPCCCSCPFATLAHAAVRSRGASLHGIFSLFARALAAAGLVRPAHARLFQVHTATSKQAHSEAAEESRSGATLLLCCREGALH